MPLHDGPEGACILKGEAATQDTPVGGRKLDPPTFNMDLCCTGTEEGECAGSHFLT